MGVNPQVVEPDPMSEFLTSERCFIIEVWNEESDPVVSIARARVTPSVTTELHSLDVDERYIIVTGQGEVHVGGREPTRIGPGDVVVIPRGVAQQVRNIGEDDLVFYCVCSPRFRAEGYQALE
jgi:mannose-6-phosphate isomerase-like protein (cupin superfamily)